MLNKTLSGLLILVFTPFFLIANDYEEGWKALAKNKRTEARQFFQKATQDPATAVDATLSLMILQTFDGHEGDGVDFYDKVYTRVPDPNPYLFSYWFNGAILGGYGKKTNSRNLDLLEKLLADKNINGSIKAAAHYVKATHYLFSNQFDNARREYQYCRSVGKWQFVGPFDNVSGSGFNKSEAVLKSAGSSASFISLTNAPVKWFVPAAICTDGWTFPYVHFRQNTAVLFGQSFVYSPTDREVFINAGVNGAMKVWVNDRLVINESKERVTELDCYRNSVKLRKGYNRLLVQNAYTNNSTPNYIIRFTDRELNDIDGLTYTDQYQDYPKEPVAAHSDAPVSLPHFAEVFFEEKIRTEPDNLLNYILLSQVYLRNTKAAEARRVINIALTKAPQNALLHFELLQILQKEGNRTLLSQEVEWNKDNDGESALSLILKMEKLKGEEKFDEAMEVLDRRQALYGEDADILSERLGLLNSQKKVDEMVKLAETSYEKYPGNAEFVTMMFNLQKEGFKNKKAALGILEKYRKSNYNYKLFTSLYEEYISQGMVDKGLGLMRDLRKQFPYDPELAIDILRFNYDKQNYKEALAICDETLQLAPYVANYWGNKGIVLEQMNNKPAAIEAYEKALNYDKTKFDARNKIRTLKGQKDIFSIFPAADYYEMIKSAKPEQYKEHPYFFILDEKQKVVYADGASEQYITFVIRINNQKGIDEWKESSVGYNENNQILVIEKAEVVKRSGAKTTAEQSGNQLVFTGLEAGDAIIIRYKLQEYQYGQLSDKFWDKYVFSGTIPSVISRYCLLVADKMDFRYEVINSSLKPVITPVDDFKLYTWQLNDAPVLKEEPLMPKIADIGQTLHISSVKDWKVIADWYSDLVTKAMEEEFEVREVYNQLFPAGKAYTDSAKAAIIYDYIESNISYSSVSFRQGAFIPQRPSATINAKLGDCKDVSALFVALARMAGLKANMVLVDTRNNGSRDMIFPSVEFNHCIVKVMLGKKEQYLELTDNNLPMGAFPTNLHHALSLLIPNKGETLAEYALAPIPVSGKKKDIMRSDIILRTEGNQIKVKTTITRYGSLSSAFRAEYHQVNETDQREQMESAVSAKYKNPFTLDSLQIPDMNKLADSIRYSYSYTVKNEVMEAGNMQMIKIPFADAIVTQDNFNLVKREFPIEYWSYEDADAYETTVTMLIPAGKQFFELPQNQQLSFKGIKYSLQYVKSAPNKLVIRRKATIEKEDIAPGEYAAFREFVEKLVQAESKFIIFK